MQTSNIEQSTSVESHTLVANTNATVVTSDQGTQAAKNASNAYHHKHKHCCPESIQRDSPINFNSQREIHDPSQCARATMQILKELDIRKSRLLSKVLEMQKLGLSCDPSVIQKIESWEVACNNLRRRHRMKEHSRRVLQAAKIQNSLDMMRTIKQTPRKRKVTFDLAELDPTRKRKVAFNLETDPVLKEECNF